MQKTLLDEFAMAALTGWLSTFHNEDGAHSEQLASFCYDQAEAMMAERAKRMEHPAFKMQPMPEQPVYTANISVNEEAVIKAIAAMKGQKATCSMICRKAANWDGDLTALREIGQILRSRGYQKVRSGGKDYYQL